MATDPTYFLLTRFFGGKKPTNGPVLDAALKYVDDNAGSYPYVFAVQLMNVVTRELNMLSHFDAEERKYVIAEMNTALSLAQYATSNYERRAAEAERKEKKRMAIMKSAAALSADDLRTLLAAAEADLAEGAAPAASDHGAGAGAGASTEPAATATARKRGRHEK